MNQKILALAVVVVFLIVIGIFAPIPYYQKGERCRKPYPLSAQQISCQSEGWYFSPSLYQRFSGEMEKTVSQSVNPPADTNVTPTITSGIIGTIEVGPTEPICRDNKPCTKPYQATVIVKTAVGLQEITRFTSDNKGKFRVSLTPETYLLEPISNGSYPRFPRCSSQKVKVEPNKFTEITISCDTGIR